MAFRVQDKLCNMGQICLLSALGNSGLFTKIIHSALFGLDDFLFFGREHSTSTDTFDTFVTV